VSTPDRLVLDFERPVVELERQIDELLKLDDSEAFAPEIESLRVKARQLLHEIFSDLKPWQKVQLSRHPGRPYTLDYVERLITDFVELHGDRLFADDESIVCGLGRFEDVPVAVVGHQKGRTTKENLRRNFGMPRPEGYRKARRVMELAARFGRPIVTFIDTPGAYPGPDAEERGQAEAIATNLEVMAGLPVPILSAVIGEGGSGGALAIGVADRLWMLEHSTYSVISPEGCASILWRDQAKATEAAEALRITAGAIRALGVCDEVVAEPPGGAHRDPDAAAQNLGAALARGLAELQAIPHAERVERRRRKYGALGAWKDGRQA
jgi:acetyl-CoA carboxylase carboxyl transferase subunit alpha